MGAKKGHSLLSFLEFISVVGGRVCHSEKSAETMAITSLSTFLRLEEQQAIKRQICNIWRIVTNSVDHLGSHKLHVSCSCNACKVA